MTISGTPVLTSTSTSSPCIPTPADLTPFRAAEKYFKSRFNSTPAPGNVNGSSVTVTEKQRRKAAKAISSGSPLDQIPYEWLGYPLLTCQGVLDLSRPELNGDGGKEAEDEVKRAGWRTDDSPFAGRTMKKIEVTKLVEKDGEKAFEEGRAYMKKEGQSSWSEDREGSLRTENKTGWIIGDGCILLPRFFSPSEQLSLLRASLSEYTLPPNPSNLATHYHTPTEKNGDSLFDLYASESDTLIHSKAEWNGSNVTPPLSSTSQNSGSAVPESASPTDSLSSQSSAKRQLIQNQSAVEEGYKKLLKKVQDWHGDAPSHKLKSKTANKLLSKELRWANLGWIYNWTNKAYDFTTNEPIPFPPHLRAQCRRIVQGIPWSDVYSSESSFSPSESPITPDYANWSSDYAPDTGIVNFYQLSDTLMGHVDRSELDPYRPLISISLGHAAVFLLGGETRETKPVPVVLRSGDVLIMSGRSRAFYHGVPRIMENTLPAHFKSISSSSSEDAVTRACKRFISTSRININARQVFPAGFKRPGTGKDDGKVGT